MPVRLSVSFWPGAVLPSSTEFPYIFETPVCPAGAAHAAAPLLSVVVYVAPDAFVRSCVGAFFLYASESVDIFFAAQHVRSGKGIAYGFSGARVYCARPECHQAAVRRGQVIDVP